MKKIFVCLILLSSLIHAQDNGISEVVPLKLQHIYTGLERPVFITSYPDDSSRLFVVEQTGRIWIIDNGVKQDTPFLDLSEKIQYGGERGLLSMALHPQYVKKRLFYVNYINSEGKTVISRFRVKKKNRDLVKQNKEKIILELDQPFGNHNGGQLQFGPDGYLYVGMGDGGSGGDPLGHGQNKTSLLGAMLRLDISKRPYRIPSDNPFVGEFGRNEIWAYGLRNPWRFSFDRETGDLYIADVGQSRQEEINFQPFDSTGGENYGWNKMEGMLRYSAKPGENTSKYTNPIHIYTRSDGASITGGYVYRGKAIPQLQGHYFFADYVFGNVWSFRYVNGKVEEFTKWTDILKPVDGAKLSISSFGEDAEGELYICDHVLGRIFKIVADE